MSLKIDKTTSFCYYFFRNINSKGSCFMNLLYNTNLDIANNLKYFFNNIDFSFSKPQLKIIPNILTSIINAENVTTLDISKVFVDDSFLSNNDSIQKKLWRFFNNPHFNGIDFFNHSIKYIINNSKALREYAHRFGAIEFLFKSQKTNGFNLEKTKTRNLHAYENLYSLVCFCCVWLSIIGIDYTKNYTHVKNKLNIRFVKRTKNNKPIRILSMFNLGLTIFRRCLNSYIDYRIKCNMQLYL